MEKSTHRTWAEIDLDAIAYNFRTIQKMADTANVLCVIKANAYGHGSIPVARRLQQEGAACFGVATVPEAVELREHGITIPILILGYVDEADAPLVARYGITAAVYDLDTAHMFAQAALAEGRDISIHFKVDTGMARLGFDASRFEETVRDILEISSMSGLRATGIFTHFAVADETDGAEYTNAQTARFEALCSALEKKGLSLDIRHCANSGGILAYRGSYMNMVRAGIILYGFYPDKNLPSDVKLRPAMQLKAHVVQVHEAEAGRGVSYGLTYQVAQKTRLAVISIGYADGYLRSASGRACILIHGRAVPIVGRICMDMCIALLPDDLAVRRGDEAVIYGAEQVTAETAAEAAGTITYEVLCAVSSRVPRFYIEADSSFSA